MPFRTPLRFAALAVLFLSATAPAGHAADRTVSAGDLVIRNPWTRATPNGAAVAVGYVTITNNGREPDTLTGGSAEAATGFEVHAMTTANGIMTMRPAGPVTIAPGATLVLAPAGTHIMMTGLKHGLGKGDTVAGTLTFARAGAVPVTFTVESLGAKAPAGAADHGGHAMPGMDMK